jgi:hypothetical protein
MYVSAAPIGTRFSLTDRAGRDGPDEEKDVSKCEKGGYLFGYGIWLCRSPGQGLRYIRRTSGSLWVQMAALTKYDQIAGSYGPFLDCNWACHVRLSVDIHSSARWMM